MRTFDVPGTVLREYRGMGRLTGESGTTSEGGFELLQTANGAVHGRFYGEDVAKLFFELRGPDQPFPEVGLDGTTIQGWTVAADCRYITGATGSTHSFKARQVEVVHYTMPTEAGEPPIHRMEFDLVNLTFQGEPMKLEIDGIGIEIRKVQDYDTIVHGLRTYNGIEVTCKASIEVGTPDPSPDACDVVSDVCQLLSFAVGTRVNWVGYEMMYLGSETLSTHLLDSITHPYSYTMPLMQQTSDQLSRFVQSTFQCYGSIKESHRVRALVNVYLMAKLPHLYLHSRLQLICQAIEALKGSFAEEFVLDEAELSDDAISALTKQIRDAWKAQFPSPQMNPDALNSICHPGCVKGMARTSFGSALRKVIRESRFAPDVEEDLLGRVTRLVRIRDLTTHAVLDIRDDTHMVWHDFTCFVNLFDLVMMRILGYSGEYLAELLTYPTADVSCSTAQAGERSR